MRDTDKLERLEGRVMALQSLVIALLQHSVQYDRKGMAKMAVGIQEALDHDCFDAGPMAITDGLRDTLDSVIKSLLDENV